MGVAAAAMGDWGFYCQQNGMGDATGTNSYDKSYREIFYIEQRFFTSGM